MGELSRKLTPIDAQTAASLMMAALSVREAEGTQRKLLAQHLLSLAWVETAHGQKMVRNNWGNLSGENQGNYWRPPWYQLSSSSSSKLRALHAAMLAGKVPDRFQAFASRGEGLDAFLSLVYRPRYAPMLRAGRAGDTAGFASAVHDTGYCPDEACRGERTLAHYQQLARTFRPLLGLPPAGGALLAKRDGSGFSGLGALALLWLLAKGRIL